MYGFTRFKNGSKYYGEINAEGIPLGKGILKEDGKLFSVIYELENEKDNKKSKIKFKYSL